MIFRPKQEPKQPRLSRLQKLRTDELLSWADITILSLGRSFDAYRYRDEPLEEVILAADTLNKILHELQERVDNGQNGQ